MGGYSVLAQQLLPASTAVLLTELEPPVGADPVEQPAIRLIGVEHDSVIGDFLQQELRSAVEHDQVERAGGPEEFFEIRLEVRFPAQPALVLRRPLEENPEVQVALVAAPPF